MHGLELYSMRIYDPNLAGPREEKYCSLDAVRGHDLLDVMRRALENNLGELRSIREEMLEANPAADVSKMPKRVFKCGRVTQQGRVLYGVIQVGEYGTRNDIVERLTGDVRGVIGVDDSVLRDHFFYVEIRPGRRSALMILLSISGKGVKGVMEDISKPEIHLKTGGLACQIRPVTHAQVAQEWLDNAQVKEVRVSQFANGEPYGDIADRLGDTYSEVVVKPRRRNTRLGSLGDVSRTLVDINLAAQSVKMQVEFNGRTRVLRLGNDEIISSIEVYEEDGEVEFQDGNPLEHSLLNYCQGIAEDFWNDGGRG